MRWPHVGVIVHYVDIDKEVCQAEIRWVHKEKPTLVCLMVYRSTLGRSPEPPYAVHDVRYSSRGKCGTWHWSKYTVVDPTLAQVVRLINTERLRGGLPLLRTEDSPKGRERYV